MQLAWLEDLTKEGAVTADERDRIYASCGELLKLAGTADKVERILGPVAHYMLPPLIDSWFGQRRQNAEVSAHMKDLAEVKEKLLAHPDFANHQDKVEARFTEVAKLAPTVARNEPLMLRILKEKLHGGLTHEDVTNLAMIQAAYTPNYTFQKKLEKAAALGTAGAIAADVLIMCKEAGLIKEGMTGRELASKTLQHAITNLTVPALLAVGAGAVNMAMDWRSRGSREKALIQSFNAAMDPNHPDTEILRSSPERAREAFKTLVHFSPSVALEPTAARSFMNKIVSYQAGTRGPAVIETSNLKELADIEKNMRGASTGSPFFKGFVGGLKETGFSDAVRKSVTPLTDPLQHQLATSIAKGFGLEPAKGAYQPLGTKERGEFNAEEEQRLREKERWNQLRLGFNEMGGKTDRDAQADRAHYRGERG